MLGTGNNSQTIYLIDMGLSKKYLCKESNAFSIQRDTFRTKRENN